MSYETEISYKGTNLNATKMEKTDSNTAGVSTVPKAATEIAKMASSELLKLHGLREYCNLIESDLNKGYKKLEMLSEAKNESTKIITEYKSRNKINANNSESLFQALNELHKYKSELKSTYVATEKALKMRKLKYKKIITSYESAWERALEQYNEDPVYVELIKIQQENAVLETEIQNREKLSTSTEAGLTDLKENLKKAFREKIIQFSKAFLQYKKFENSTHLVRENDSENPKGKFEFKLFRETPPCNHPDNGDDPNYICSVDVSVFDDITVPSENLESPNLEEDSTLANVSKNDAPSEYLNKYQQNIQQKPSIKDREENADDKESHYFRAQPSETSRQPQNEQQQPTVEQCNRSKENFNKHPDNSGEKLKSINNAAELQGGEESSRDMQMECDEFISDGSYEKQMLHKKGDESQHQKTSSFSSEDVPPPGEILKDSPEPKEKPCVESKKPDLEKKESKAFTGFFTSGNDQETEKPSILKLF